MIESVAGPARRHVLDRAAVRLARVGVPADAVTVAGTVGVVAASLMLVASGELVAGSLLVALSALADALDGALARASGRAGAWGAFLDSTLDRVADAALLGAVAFWFHSQGDGRGLVLALACLATAPLVPYARARAEGLGAPSPDGIAARADRLTAVLAGLLAVGLGAPVVVLHVVLGLLLVGIAVTTAQRMRAVRRHLLAARPARTLR
ncbi:MAG: CDP-alcohol phosphatidyltransferase family protein [Kineosporiaceae bacterium]